MSKETRAKTILIHYICVSTHSSSLPVHILPYVICHMSPSMDGWVYMCEDSLGKHRHPFQLTRASSHTSRGASVVSPSLSASPSSPILLIFCPFSLCIAEPASGSTGLARSSAVSDAKPESAFLCTASSWLLRGLGVDGRGDIVLETSPKTSLRRRRGTPGEDGGATPLCVLNEVLGVFPEVGEGGSGVE